MKFLIAIMVVLVAVIVIVPQTVWSNTRDTVTCTVESKDRTAKPKGGSDQRLYTDCGILNVGDDWLNGQWNSSDLYAQIEDGKTYKFNTAGWRNGFFSQFPNVYEAKEVS